MKHVTEFRDPALARALLAEIARLADGLGATRARPLHIMEVCGGHTHAIFRFGLDRLVHPGIEFVHGPGCPVCVLPMDRIDACIALAERPGVILATYGDAMRVPGTRGTLLQARARGADIRMVYSPLDALQIAHGSPDREVVFLGLGFETTTPATAFAIIAAAREGLANFSVLCTHITVPEPVRALLSDPDMALDGLIGPGHVAMVIGTRAFDFVARTFRRPIVVAGFEPLDLLQALAMVLRQLAEGRAEVENQYARVVPEHGNPLALAAMETVFMRRPSCDWRGLGAIADSGLAIRPAFAAFDAEAKFAIGDGAAPPVPLPEPAPEPEGCACGAVMTGRMKPTACPQYGRGCTPETPLGALMVSSEGACAAYWHYGGARAAAG